MQPPEGSWPTGKEDSTGENNGDDLLGRRYDGARYKIDCQICKKEGTQATYFGESGYNCYLRGGQHLKAIEGHNMASPLYNHNVEMHPDKQIEATNVSALLHGWPTLM